VAGTRIRHGSVHSVPLASVMMIDSTEAKIGW
jgi:hypothetical protein